ncbi:MAG: PspC domain-containing protein, partial [Candidatus Saccharibacteria bacterium]
MTKASTHKTIYIEATALSRNQRTGVDYWAEGMAKWEKVYSRQWVDPVAIPPSTPTSPPVSPMRAASSFNNDNEVHPDNRFFSPYATFYRSQDDKWAYGIFGGLAHRNSWSPSLL